MAFDELVRQVCAKNGWKAGESEATVPLGGRSQRVAWMPFRHGSAEMVRLFSLIGGGEALSPTRYEAALALNFNLPHGALAIHEKKLVMTDTFLVSEADAAEVEGSIRFIAEMADRYEKFIYGQDRN